MSDSAESEKVSSNTDSGFRNLVTGEFLSLCSDRGTVNFELYFVWLIERPVHVHEYRYVMFTGTLVTLVFSPANGSSGFKAEKGRYHLYVCLACPWAHRTLICLKLKGLDDVISVNAVDYLMGTEGWRFNPSVSQYERFKTNRISGNK